MSENMSVLEKLDVVCNLLDKLADAQGRAKCGYIYIIDDFINKIRSDVLIMEEQLKDKNEDTDENVAVTTEE